MKSDWYQTFYYILNYFTKVRSEKMISFLNDYSEGAHPRVLQRL